MDSEPNASNSRDTNEDLFSEFDGVSRHASTVQPGTEIGPYRLLRLLGVGGMGQVWMAEQGHPVRRVVALKLIREGADTKRIIARFEAERQALAIMNHSNIAKVYDAGTTQAGMPYFVMELVRGDDGDGISLTKFCDENQLDIRERLRLFSQVCSAVQHAHHRGIVHRDLKPNNILVAAGPDGPVPKVIDFGLAKALDTAAQFSNLSIETEAGKPVGTFHYMSPEQASGQEDVDARTDIYSLGVLLYELLSGSRPIDSTNPMIAWKSILDETPRLPSDRFSETVQSNETVAENRQIAPGRLKQILRGELDWVVMKALEKDRRRRYQSANEFSDDVQRFLNNEPVEARPPSRLYKLSKFLSNNRLLVASTALVLCALLGGAYGLQWGISAEETKRTVAAMAYWFRSADRWMDGKTEDAIDFLRKIDEEYRTPSWHHRRRQYEGDDQIIYGTPGDAKIRDLAANADATTLAWCSREGIHIFDVVSKEVIRTLRPDSIQYVNCVALSRDAKTLAAGFADNSIVIWRLNGNDVSKLEINDFRQPKFRVASPDEDTNTSPPKPSDGIRQIEISPDGARVVSGGADGFLRLFDAVTGHQLANVAHSEASTSQIPTALAKDGTGINDVTFGTSNEVFSASSDGHFAIWGVKDASHPQPHGCSLKLVSSTHCPALVPVGKTTQLIPGGGRLVPSPNRMELLALRLTGDEKSLGIEDAANFDLADRQGFNVRTTVQIWDAKFSPDGSRAAAIVRNVVQIWDLRKRTQLFRLQGHFGRVTGAEFTGSGSQLLTSGQDGTIRIWDVTSGSQAPRLRGHVRSVMGVAIDEEYNIVSTGDGGTVRSWGWETGESRLIHGEDLSKPANAVAFSSNNKLAYSRGQHVLIQPRSVATSHLSESSGTVTLDHGTNVNAIAFNRAGNVIATVGSDLGSEGEDKKRSELRLWDSKSGKLLAKYDHGFEQIRSVDFNHRGLVATGTRGGENEVRVFDPAVDKTAPVRTLADHTDAVYSVAFQPHGDILIAGSKSDLVLMWDTRTWELIGEVRAYSDAYSLAFTPDGSRFAVGLGKGNIKLFALREGELPYEEIELIGHDGPKRQIRALCFSPDGSLLLSASSDRTVGIWDFRPQEESNDLIRFPKRLRTDSITSWHSEQAEQAYWNNDPYSEMFHRAWVDRDTGELSEAFVRAAKEVQARLKTRGLELDENLPEIVRERLVVSGLLQ